MTQFIAFCIVSFAVFSYGSCLKWRDCGSKEGKVADIQTKGCITSDPLCVAKKGTNVTFSATFTPSEKVEKLSAVVHGIIAGIPIPFPLPNPDACKDSGLQCPLASGKSASYVATLPILPEYPAIRVAVKWELKDGNGNDVMCIEMGIQIQGGNKENTLHLVRDRYPINLV